MAPEDRCPACERKVINRRLEQCEFCGAALPAELLMSDEERARELERAAESEQRAREKRADEREARAEKRKRTSSGGGLLPPFTLP